MWEETVQANLAAMADVDRMRAAQGKGPARCGHYPSWLGYGYLQLGKMDEAKTALTACRATVESQAGMDHAGMSMSMDPDSSLSRPFANMRLRYLLDTGELTGAIANLPLPKSAGPAAWLDFAFARALGEIAGANRRSAPGVERTRSHGPQGRRERNEDRES